MTLRLPSSEDAPHPLIRNHRDVPNIHTCLLVGLDDAKLSQVAQLHVTKGLPGTDHCRVCKVRKIKAKHKI